jgi:membrane protease YdiL (CAAX protease family)
MEEQQEASFNEEHVPEGAQDLLPVPSLWPLILGYLGMVALPFLAAFIIGIAVAALDPHLVQAGGKLDSNKLSNVLTKNVLVQLFEQIFLWAGMLLSVLYVSTHYKIAWRELVVWRVDWRKDIPLAFAIYLVTTFGAGLYLMLLQHITNTHGKSLGNATTVLQPESRWNWVFAMIAVLFAPIIEEVFFRGLAYYVITARFGSIIAVVASATMFALAHFQTTLAATESTVGIIFITGICFGFARSKTNRLGTSLLAHVLFNIVAVIAVYK